MSSQTANRTALVTGATGLLGREVFNKFEILGWNVIGTGYSRAKPPKIVKLDLTDGPAVESLIKEKKPDVIVHCAAERSPEVCDKDAARARELNVDTVQRLAELTAQQGTLFIYISTDYVFPGTPGDAPYEAEAATNPPNFYGQTKLDGEIETRKGNPERGVVFRVPVLYGDVDEAKGEKESAVNVLLDVVWNREKKKEVQMDHWSLRYPTNTRDVARVLTDVSEKYLSASSEELSKLPKILQFSAEEKMTKYEICQTLGEITGLPIDHIVPNAKGPDAAAGGTVRPFDCHLSTKALKEIGIDTDAIRFSGWWKWHLGAFRH
ncbi:NAD(P)-binding protein [Ascobolus immersus RN42]|uniref:NAD(P)-binding protein n=1 Tax=Ascobolus immersus RN42 TaxID=1160509 RepID=A0A3N4HT01_ASCIM|nr:NAD(P)-binding protein [Ascobolus immersus RN42]